MEYDLRSIDCHVQFAYAMNVRFMAIAGENAVQSRAQMAMLESARFMLPFMFLGLNASRGYSSG